MIFQIPFVCFCPPLFVVPRLDSSEEVTSFLCLSDSLPPLSALAVFFLCVLFFCEFAFFVSVILHCPTVLLVVVYADPSRPFFRLVSRLSS